MPKQLLPDSFVPVGNFIKSEPIVSTVVKDFERLIEKTKLELAEQYFQLGDALHKEKRHDKAIQVILEGISFKENFRAYHKIGLILFSQNKKDEAQKYFNKSIELELESEKGM